MFTSGSWQADSQSAPSVLMKPSKMLYKYTSMSKIKVEMCVYDAMAAILNNLYILKMLKVSHLHGPPLTDLESAPSYWKETVKKEAVYCLKTK